MRGQDKSELGQVRQMRDGRIPSRVEVEAAKAVGAAKRSKSAGHDRTCDNVKDWVTESLSFCAPVRHNQQEAAGRR